MGSCASEKAHDMSKRVSSVCLERVIVCVEVWRYVLVWDRMRARALSVYSMQ